MMLTRWATLLFLLMQVAIAQTPSTCTHRLTRTPNGPILVYRNGLLQKQNRDYVLTPVAGSAMSIVSPSVFSDGDSMSVVFSRAVPLSFQSQGTTITYWGYQLWREDWDCVGNQPVNLSIICPIFQSTNPNWLWVNDITCTLAIDGISPVDTSISLSLPLELNGPGVVLIPAGHTVGTFSATGASVLVAPTTVEVDVQGQARQYYAELLVPCCARVDMCGLTLDAISQLPCQETK